jgi:hypothetical protein
MTKTVTALYPTNADAEHARDALRLAHLGDHVTIHDRTRDHARRAAAPKAGPRDLSGAERDAPLYDEGMRRGHFLLAARVGDMKETRAAEILDATDPVDLDKADMAWRADGWAPATPPVSVDYVRISTAVRIYDFAD